MMRALHLAAAVWAIWPRLALAQLQAIQDTIGVRIETMTILGGDQGIGNGAYAFRGDTEADLSIFKIGGGGEVGRWGSVICIGARWVKVTSAWPPPKTKLWKPR